MRKAPLRLAISIAGVVAVFVCAAAVLVTHSESAFRWLEHTGDWTVEAKKKSPHGEFAALLLRSNDDGVGPAPYGEQIAIVPSSFWFPKYSEFIVFAGECNHQDFSWISDRELEIECSRDSKAASVRQLDAFQGIRIHYKISISTPHK